VTTSQLNRLAVYYSQIQMNYSLSLYTATLTSNFNAFTIDT